MHIQVRTTNQVDGGERMNAYVEGEVSEALSRFKDRITRAEVHISDENGDKSGGDDKRCQIEVRVAGMQPVSVHANESTIDQALKSALDKMISVLSSENGRRKDQRHQKVTVTPEV